MAQPPQTLDDLGESLQLWDKLSSELPRIEEKFGPLYEQFVILEKYEVAISKDVSDSLVFYSLVLLFITLCFGPMVTLYDK